MPDSPQLSYPFRLTASGAAECEDSSAKDLLGTALMAIRTPRMPGGWFPHNPGFGVGDTAFLAHPGRRLSDGLLASDDRINVLVTEDRDRFDASLARIVARIAAINTTPEDAAP